MLVFSPSRYDLPLGEDPNAQKSTAASAPQYPGFFAAVFNTTKLKEPNQLSALIVRVAVVMLGK
jgi:hypothetical protein